MCEPAFQVILCILKFKDSFCHQWNLTAAYHCCHCPLLKDSVIFFGYCWNQKRQEYEDLFRATCGFHSRRAALGWPDRSALRGSSCRTRKVPALGLKMNVTSNDAASGKQPTNKQEEENEGERTLMLTDCSLCSRHHSKNFIDTFLGQRIPTLEIARCVHTQMQESVPSAGTPSNALPGFLWPPPPALSCQHKGFKRKGTDSKSEMYLSWYHLSVFPVLGSFYPNEDCENFQDILSHFPSPVLHFNQLLQP